MFAPGQLREARVCVQGGLRVTEQGEMVHSKFGSPDIAQVTMESFTTAVVEARLLPPSPPRRECWRDIMEELSSISCEAYRCARPHACTTCMRVTIHLPYHSALCCARCATLQLLHVSCDG